MSQTINIQLLVLNPKDVYRYLNVQRRRPKRTQHINNDYLDSQTSRSWNPGRYWPLQVETLSLKNIIGYLDGVSNSHLTDH